MGQMPLELKLIVAGFWVAVLGVAGAAAVVAVRWTTR